MRLLSEPALARRAVAGDRAAFAEIFRRYRQPLFGFCVSVVGNQEDGQDALQNTMAKALKSLPGEQRDLKLKPWLFRVAHNECIDFLRARRYSEDITAHEPESTSGVESEVLTRERLRGLLLDLEDLPERQRGALVMRELSGLSFEEIGVAINCSADGAKQAVYEARCSLQDQAEGREMDCESVRALISERDGRMLRGRQVRAHLRSCEACRDFRAGIETRSRDFRILMPPVPAALALSISQMIGGSSGGGAATAGLVGLSGGKAALGGTAVKGIAVVAVAAGVGAGAVGVVEHSGRNGDRGSGTGAITRDSGVSGQSAIEGPTSGTGLRSEIGRRPRPGNKMGEVRQSGPGRGSAPRKSGPSARLDRPGKGATGKGTSLPPSVPPGPPAGRPGGSGGAKGRGAVPSHGGKPSALPDAAAKGQSQAASHAAAKGAGGTGVKGSSKGSSVAPATPGSSGSNGSSGSKPKSKIEQGPK